jgi:tape measure domain-containing protein
MAHGDRTVTVKIETVAGNNAGKKVIADIEKDVEASNKRIIAGKKTTNRIIEEADKAQARSARTVAKQQADDFIRELKRIENERKRIERESTSFRSSTSAAFGGGLVGGFIGSAAISGISKATSLVEQGASAWLDYASKVEQAKIGMTAMTGSTILAQKHLQELQSFAAKTPFSFEELVLASQKMQGVGIEAKKVIPLLTDVGNALSAAGRIEDLSFAVKALGDIQAKGKLAGQEIIQLANAGIPAIKMLSDYLGKSSAEILKMGEDGEISADTLFKALHKMSSVKFGDAMMRQSKTFLGAMRNIQDILLQTANTAFQPFYDRLSKLAVTASNDIQKQRGDFVGIGKTIGMAIGEGIGYALGMAIRDIGSAMSAAPNQSAIVSAFVAGLAGTGKGLYTGVTSVGSSPAARIGGPAIDYSRPGSLHGVNNPFNTNMGGDGKEGTATSTMLGWMRHATMGQESGGNLFARNGRTGASGLFQVMPHNIGPWTREALNFQMTPEAFMRSPKAQEAVFNLKMGQYLDKARKVSGGNDDTSIRMAAAAWYGGEGAMGRFDDPTKFRKNEPSFREYTSSVLDRAKRAKLIGGSGIDAGDISKELKAYAENESDQLTEGNRRKVLSVLWDLYAKAGLVPSDDLIKEFATLSQTKAKEMGVEQSSAADISNVFIQRAQAMGGSVSSESQPLGTSVRTRDQVNATKQFNDALVDLDEQIFSTRDATNEEIVTRKIALGVYGELSDLEQSLLITRAKSVDDLKTQMRLDQDKKEHDEKVVQEIENLKREEYQKTRDVIEESLDYLSRGDFKGFGRAILERQRQAVVEKTTDWILDKLGIQNPDDTPELREAKKQTKLLQAIAGQAGGPLSAGPLGLGGLFGGNQGGGIFNYGGGGSGGGSASGSGGGGFNSVVSIPGVGPVPIIKGGGKGGFFGGLGSIFGARKNYLNHGNLSKMGGMMGGIGDIASMAGGMIGGKWGNLISMAGQGASIGSMFGPWGAAIGAAAGGLIGLFTGGLFGGDNSIKKIKEAALSTYGITVKDKSVLKTIKQLGEQYFGKGKAGANATQLMQVDEVKEILKNYAEASGQSSMKIDRLSYGDENWKGNQFRSSFGGFKAMGGPVGMGRSYIVGERGPEMFTPAGSGTITPNHQLGGQQLNVILGSLADVIESLDAKITSMRPGDVVAAGAKQNPKAIREAQEYELQTDLRAGTNQFRLNGQYT